MLKHLGKSKIETWRTAAIADGWEHSPIYKLEAEETATLLKKKGFTVQVYLRDNSSSIAMWGPDDLAIPVTFPYNFEQIKKALNICTECNIEGQTVRIGFAGRVCPKCRKKLVPTVEYSGWCD